MVTDGQVSDPTWLDDNQIVLARQVLGWIRIVVSDLRGNERVLLASTGPSTASPRRLSLSASRERLAGCHSWGARSSPSPGVVSSSVASSSRPTCGQATRLDGRTRVAKRYGIRLGIVLSSSAGWCGVARHPLQ